MRRKMGVPKGSADPGKLEALFMENEQKRIAAKLKQSLLFIKNLMSKNMSKDESRSQKLREQANMIYSKKGHSSEEHLQVCQLYSESIAIAPPASKEMSAALYNRSSMFYHLKKYPECFQDLIYAEKCECSEILKMKIAYRKAECSSKIKIPGEQNIIDRVIADIMNLTLDSSIKEETVAKLKKINQSSKATSKCTEKKDDLTQSLKVDFQKEIPCASSAITLKYNEEYGRHIVSTRYIKPGEILAVEKMHLALNQSHLYTHCSYCSRFTWASIPCRFCIFAVYCSEKCKDEAWNQYHDIECSIIGVLYSVEFDPTKSLSSDRNVMTSRLIIQALKESNGSISELKNKLEKIDRCKDNSKRGFTNGILRSDSCESLLSLLTNAHLISLHELEATSLLAARTACLILLTGVLNEKCNTNIDSMISEQTDIQFIGALIARMYHASYSNEYKFEQSTSPFPRLSWSDLINPSRLPKVETIGSGIAPFCSLINHACLQNAVRCVTDDGHMLIYAALPIQKNTQVFTSYGGDLMYYINPKTLRQQEMRRRLLPECKCVACVEDWPLGLQCPSIRGMTRDQEVLSMVSEIQKQTTHLTKEIRALTDMVMKCLERIVKKSLYPSVEFTTLINNLVFCHKILYEKYLQIPPGCKK